MQKINNKLQKKSKKLYRGKSHDNQIGIPFPVLSFFEIVIKYNASAGMGIDISFDNISQDNLYLILIFDTFVEAKAELYIYAVFYIPSRMSPIQINFVVDLRGTVSDGRSGIKLEFSFMEQKFDLNVYFVLNIFKLDFYFKYCIYINLPFTKYNKEFYI